MCFLGIFCVFFVVWKREKTCREVGPRAKLSKIPFFFFLFERCLGLFIASGTFFEETALQGLSASKDLGFLFLKRYET